VPIDYRATPAADYLATATGGEGFDVIFDTVGGAALDEAFTAVRTTGRSCARSPSWPTRGSSPRCSTSSRTSWTPQPTRTGRWPTGPPAAK